MRVTCVGNKKSFKKNEGKRLGEGAQAQPCSVLRNQNKQNRAEKFLMPNVLILIIHKVYFECTLLFFGIWLNRNRKINVISSIRNYISPSASDQTDLIFHRGVIKKKRHTHTLTKLLMIVNICHLSPRNLKSHIYCTQATKWKSYIPASAP